MDIADHWYERANRRVLTPAEARDEALRRQARAAMAVQEGRDGKRWLWPTRRSVELDRERTGAADKVRDRLQALKNRLESSNQTHKEGSEMAKTKASAIMNGKARKESAQPRASERYDALRPVVNPKLNGENPCRSDKAKAIFEILGRAKTMAEFRDKASAVHKGCMSYFRESLERDYVVLVDAAGKSVVTYKDTPGGHPLERKAGPAAGKRIAKVKKPAKRAAKAKDGEPAAAAA